jgi:hypothetical protein
VYDWPAGCGKGEVVLKQEAKARDISLAMFWASSILPVNWGEVGSDNIQAMLFRYLQPSPDPHTALTSALFQES